MLVGVDWTVCAKAVVIGDTATVVVVADSATGGSVTFENTATSRIVAIGDSATGGFVAIGITVTSRAVAIGENATSGAVGTKTFIIYRHGILI